MNKKLLTRVQGGSEVKLLECVNPIKDKWRVRWDVKPASRTVADGDSSADNGITYMEAEFRHKPTVSEVKELVLSWHNAEIDRKILQGFVWRDIPVWLSSENQFNFKVAYDLTVQMQGANLPLKMKLGELEDGTPAYFEFTTVEDFADFYGASVEHVQRTLAEGWKRKDGIEWQEYKEE